MPGPDGKGNGRDAAAALVQFRRQLSKLSPKDRLEALVEVPNAARLVRSMPAEDLYLVISDVGLADSTELVRLASPAQFRTFVDLAGWKGDRGDVDEVIRWLRAARGGSAEDFLEKLHQLDFELLTLVLQAGLVVHDRESDPDIDPSDVMLETPDGKYAVEMKLQGPSAFALREITTSLVAENPLQASQLLEAIRWELPSELEETAYRFRTGRLQDLGFPPLEEALGLFTFVDPDRERGSFETLGEGEARLRAVERVDYLAAAVQGLMDAERDTLEEELRYLVNSAMVAEGSEPGDLAAQRRTTETTGDYLSLGFERLTRGNPQQAADLVRHQSLKLIFQIGFSLTLKLKFRADRLAREPLAIVEDTYLLMPHEAAVVRALRRKRPLRALAVEGAEPVMFRSHRELHEAGAALGRAEHQVAIFSALLGGTLDAAKGVVVQMGMALSALGVERLFRASIVNALLNQDAGPRPLESARLGELCERLFETQPVAPQLRPGVGEKVARALRAVVAPPHWEELGRMIEKELALLLSELAPPFFAGGLSERAASEALVFLPKSA
jgi:hypothetical protein